MAEELLVNIVGDASKLKAELDKAGGSITSFATKASKAGKGIAIAGGLITAAFGLTVKSAIGFNKEMANIATLIPGSTKRVNELKSAIRTMAVEVGKDTTDLAQGAYQVISAFGDTADTVAILGIAAKAATAGVATTTDAINLLSAVTKGYGDTSKEAVQKVSDLAFQTVTLGQTTFPELAGSIGRVTPLAASLGVGMDELFAVMATGTGVTGNAAAVSTQLRGVLQSLMAPTKDMTALTEDLEYASGEAMLQELGLAGALDAIVKAAEDSGKPLQDYISSIEGQTLALALTGAQSDTYTEKLAAMRDATGLSDIAFKEQTEGVNAAGFAFEQAKIQITVLAQEIGDMLLPTLTPLINKVTEILGKVRDWVEVNKPLVETIVKWGAGIGAALLFLGPLLIMLPGIIVALGLLKIAFLPFLVAGVIIIGIAALAKTFKELKETIYLTAEEARKMTLADLNKSIGKVMKSVSELERDIEAAEFGEAKGKIAAITINRWKKELEELNSTLDMLCVIRQELTDAEKEGTDVTEELTEIDKAMADQQEKINELLKDYAAGLKGIPKEIEEVERVTKTVKDAIYELTHTAIEVQIKALYELATKWQDAGVDMDLVAEYVELATEAIYKQNEVIDENIGLLEEIARVTKDVEDAIYELTAEPYEVVLKGISEKYEDLIEKVKESTWTAEEKKDKIDELNDSMEKEIELVDKTTEAEKEAIEAAKLLADTTKSVTDKILEMTDPLAYNIQQIDELAETWRLAGVDAELIAEAVRLLKEALEPPPDIGPWEDFFASLKAEVGSFTDIAIKFFKDMWDAFWGGIENAITSFLTMAETNAEILEDMAEAEADYFDELADLQEDYAKIVSDIVEEMAQEKEDYYDDVAKAEADNLKKLAKLQKDYNKIVSDGIKKLAREKEDYYDDLVDLERRYNRRVSDGIKDLARENEDYDIDMRRLTEERDRAAMAGDDKRAEYYQEKMEDCTLAHTRAVEDMKENQKELAEDHNTKLAKMEKDHKETMEAMIKKKDEEAQNALDKIKDVKEDHEELLIKMEKEHKEAMEALIKEKNEETQNALNKIKDLKEKYEELMAKMESEMVTVGGISDTFWSTMKTAGINALSMLITELIKYVALWLLSLGPVGWAILLGVGVLGAIWLQSKAIGGEIEKALGGAMKMVKGGLARFAVGGMGTDTVLTMLTPGEYVIAKPMTDFIKRFRTIPESLTGAIAGGLPTPIPALATGGSVGTSNITTSGFGETRIYIDIHDNRISDEIDIKRLAVTVGDEMTRRLNARRRY